MKVKLKKGTVIDKYDVPKLNNMNTCEFQMLEKIRSLDTDSDGPIDAKWKIKDAIKEVKDSVISKQKKMEKQLWWKSTGTEESSLNDPHNREREIIYL